MTRLTAFLSYVDNGVLEHAGHIFSLITTYTYHNLLIESKGEKTLELKQSLGIHVTQLFLKLLTQGPSSDTRMREP